MNHSIKHQLLDQSGRLPWKTVGICLLALLMSVGLVVFYFGTGRFLTEYSFPAWTSLLLLPALFSVPAVWLRLYKNHRLCLILSAFILLCGDHVPALASPAVLLMTLPNLLYLAYQHRHGRIRFLVLPLVLLSALYAVMSIVLNTLDHDIMISFGKVVNIGWLGVFGGSLLVYHIIYLTLSLYHVACYDKTFLQRFAFILTLFVNVVALIGLGEFLINTVANGEGAVRVSSIMRLSTRLAPFLAVSLPLFIEGFMSKMHAGQKKWKLYWILSLAVNGFVLLLTQTRGAVFIGVMLLLFYALSQSARGGWRSLLKLTGVLAVLVGLYFLISHGLDLHYFARFNEDSVDSGMEKRLAMWQSYQDSLMLQDTSWLRMGLHTLFGYGWFAERFYVYPLNMDAHNTFISVFTTFGLVGGLLYYTPFLWLMGLTLRGMVSASNEKIRPQYAMAAALMVSYLLSGFVHNKFYSPIESAYLWMLVMILIREDLPKLFPQEKSSLHLQPLQFCRGLNV